MLNIYDKLLFALSILLAVGGVITGLSLSAPELEKPITGDELRGEDYTVIEAPEIKSAQIQWDEPPFQEPNKEAWRYGIFSPPKIFYNTENGKLVEEPIKPPEPLPPFGLQLVEMGHPEYPIRFDAYFESSSGAASDSTVTLYHEEREESSGILAEGDVIKEWGINVLRISETTKKLDDGSQENVVSVKIKDADYNRVFELIPGRMVTIEDVNIITMMPVTEDGDKRAPRFKWDETEDTHQVGEATYKLIGINFEEKTVTVRKTAPQLPNPQERTLQLQR